MSDQIPTMQSAVAEATAPDEEAIQGNNQEQEVAAQGEQAAEILNDPKATPTEKKAAQKMLRKLTLKVDGEEFEEELPFEIPDNPKSLEYMRQQLQLSKVSKKRMEEKAMLEKDVVKFFEDLKKNPRKALADPSIGMDLKKFAAEIIEEEIENSKKSPEQLKHEKLEAELKALKEERELEKETAKQKEYQILVDKYSEDYDNQISQALEGNQIPKSPAAVKKITDYLIMANKAKKDVSVKDIIPIIKEELESDFREHLNALPDDKLSEFMGKDIYDRIRKQNVAKAKKANANPALKTKVADTGSKKTEATEVKKRTFKEEFGF
jgi:hypothetical protein